MGGKTKGWPERDKAMTTHKHTKAELEAKAKEELKAFLLVALYLWVFFASFTVYRRLIMAETGVSYLHYGFALIEALIIAKVILIGNLFGFSRRFQDRPLIVPVIYKSFMFGGLVLLFALAEHIVEGWFHGEGLVGGLRELLSVGTYELAARALILIVALVPLFAFTEIARVLGPGALPAMFFAEGESKPDGH
jgi:hypothetical protein